MRTRVRLIWFLGLLAGCSSPSAPTKVPTTNSQPPTVVAAPSPTVPSLTCTSAKPQHFHVSSGLKVNDKWKNEFRWDALPGDQVYIVWVRKLEMPTAFTFTETGNERDRYDVPSGRYEAKVRLACSDVWSDLWPFTNEERPADPGPAPTPRCTGKHGCGK